MLFLPRELKQLLRQLTLRQLSANEENGLF